MSHQVIASTSAPAAVGPYSQAIKAGNLLFCSGQLGLDPATGKLVAGGIEAETRRALENLDAVLEAAGADRKAVVKTMVFMADLAEFPAMNAVYEAFFKTRFPARSTIQAGLPKGARVEIEAVVSL